MTKKKKQFTDLNELRGLSLAQKENTVYIWGCDLIQFSGCFTAKNVSLSIRTNSENWVTMKFISTLIHKTFYTCFLTGLTRHAETGQIKLICRVYVTKSITTEPKTSRFNCYFSLWCFKCIY